MAQDDERLAALTAAGTSVWLDQIRRNLITSGELERLERELSLRGVTSNPAIFEKAILGSTDYDEQIAELAPKGLSAREIYDEIAVLDVQLACDVLRPVWDEANHADGFVSLEVEPALAHDTDATLKQAREYWERVDRPNLMTDPRHRGGVPAIEEAIAGGINVNVTLLFSVESYTAIAEAFIRGRSAASRPRSLDVHSVASSLRLARDTEVDKRSPMPTPPTSKSCAGSRLWRTPGGVPALQGAVPRRALRSSTRRRRDGQRPCGPRPA